MKSEWNNSGKEFADSVEIHQPKDLSGYVPVEFAQPQKEFADFGYEFIEEQKDGGNPGGESKGQKKTDKLRKKMSYLVTSSVAVIMLAASVDASGSIEQNVIHAGGLIDGDLRFSIQWNEDGDNPNDFDAYCIEPDGYTIYYSNAGYESPSKGTLDVDIRYPATEVAVENIIYPEKRDLKEGTYCFQVHNFSHRGGTSGFEAEIEINNRVYHFNYDRELAQGESVVVAEVTWENGRFSIDKKID